STAAPSESCACWERIDGPIVPEAPITRIAVHPTQPNTAYVTMSGFSKFAHVWKTVDGGKNWLADVNDLPPGLPPDTVSSEPSFPERVYVGLDSNPQDPARRASLFRSLDGGATWSPFADGLPNVPIFEISIDEAHGRIYAATHGRGAFVLGAPFFNNFEAR